MQLVSANYLARKNNAFCRFLNRVLYHCQIGHTTIIPESINLGHDAIGVIIGEGVKIGKNVKIYPYTIIGVKDISQNIEEYPIIEDNVVIGPYCVIAGNITIGKNSVIGMGTYVNRNIPANSIVYTKKELIIK